MIRFVDQVNTPINFGTENLPILISGREGSGASFFSVSLAVSLFLSGKKLVFFSARDHSKDQFLEQTKAVGLDCVLVNESIDILNISNQKVVFVKSGDKELFKETLARIIDKKDRIVFIKNIEETLDVTVLDEVSNNQKVILSGDLDRSEIIDEICKIDFDTKVFFSNVNKIDIIIPQIPKRQGVFLCGKQRSKIVKVLID